MTDNTLRNHQEPPSSHRKKGIQSVAIATVLMIIGLTLSKSTGFLREIFVIQKFGSNDLSDAFYLGLQVPDLFFQLLVGGSIQAAITPTLARSLETGHEKKGWRSVSIFISVMVVAMSVLVLLGVLLSENFFQFFYLSDSFSGIVNKTYSKTTIDIAIQSSKVLFPQVFFMMLAALCIGILNAYKKFSSTAFGPTMYNIFVVLSILILGGTNKENVVHVAIGITASAGIYFLFQSYMARHELTHFRFSLNTKDSGFRTLLRLAIPTMISASVMQLNTIVISWFAGAFDSGTMTSLRNATTIWQLPYGIFAVAVGSVMLPSLAGHFAAKDNKAARGLLSRSLRNALFLTIPSAGILFAMRIDVVYAIFDWRGKYGPQAASVTATVLMGYCIAIVMYTMIFIYNQAFYAIGKTKIPLFNGLLTLVLSVFFCWLLIRTGVGPISLSLAYSLTSIISILVLSTLYGRNKKLAPKAIFPFLVRALLCLLVLLLILFTLNSIPFEPQGKIMQLFWFGFRAVAGLGGYLLTARVFQMRELSSVLDRFKRGKK